ncbi:DUF262 domain-containing protein [Pelistega sp. MC2]|uniref:DUF262 domain-containing protein n=1 Tax=Pelistega sp. MC2 TaxID=1720297 RepID=UPI0008D9ABA2|nr:DUF262 domain-containing protein [Pelistega sp. MC2]
MTSTNFKTENNTFRKLIGNGLVYRIPRFQRDYSWESEQWEDLWEDILAVVNKQENAHYMGYLVLQSNDDKVFDVIDGQQRLTTLSIVVLAILKNIQRLVDEGIHAGANSQRLTQISQTYIGYLDPVTLVARPKLTLNRNNNDYFQTYLVPLRELPRRGFRASEHLLRRAFEWFDRQVSNYIKGFSDVDVGQTLAQLVEDISDRLFFTVITVADELNAYKVFETLNARGVRLSSTDLLKNYLFSVLDKPTEHPHEIDALEARWEGIVNRLQSDNFSDFLKIHWNSRYKFVRHQDLFKTIRSFIKDRRDVFSLLKGMEDDLDNYLALTSPELSSWSTEDKESATILKMLRVRQPFSLLLVARNKFNDKSFTQLFNAIVIISLRYNTIGAYSPNEQDRVYNDIAGRLSSGSIDSINQVWSFLKKIYIDDKRFKNDFSEKSIKTTDSRSRKIVKFILCGIERHISGSDLDYMSDNLTIEHVLPQNAFDDWEGFNHQQVTEMIYRLGNLLLLPASVNTLLGDDSYINKREKYLHSSIGLTRQFAQENESWSPEKMAAWQTWLAKQAVSIWRVDQLA